MPRDAEARRAYQRQWELANRERLRESKRDYERKRRDDPEYHAKSIASGQRYRERHRAELNARAAAYRVANPEKVRETQAKLRAYYHDYQIAWYRQLRAETLAAYGGACACCGDTTFAFLSIDHVQNDGGEHRRAGGGSGMRLYQWLKKHGYPRDRFQVLCYNCNCAKQHDRAGHRAAHPRAYLIDGGDTSDGSDASAAAMGQLDCAVR